MRLMVLILSWTVLKKMSENGKVEKSRIIIDASEDSLRTSSESVKLFTKELVRVGVERDGSCFLALEDEVIGVEHLLAEPNCNDLVEDGILNFDTFNPQSCFNIEEYSAPECGYFRNDTDTLDSSLSKGRKAKDKILEGMLEGADDKDLPDACEDYLLDTEFNEDISKFSCVPSKGSCMRHLDSEKHSPTLGGRDCGDEISKLSNASIPVLEVTCDESTFLLDKRTYEELDEVVENMFEHETAVTDKQLLKHRIAYGLQGLDELDNGLGLLESHVNSNEDKVEIGNDESSIRGSNAFTGVFNFKTKPRVRHVKRKRHAGSDSLMKWDSDVGTYAFGFPDLGEKESIVVTGKRLRRPTQRYIDNSLEQKSRYKKGKCGISDTCSKDKILPIEGDGQHFKRGCASTPRVCRKDTFRGACIQVPFGPPVWEGSFKKKGHESKKCRDDRLHNSNVNSGAKPYSAESPDDTSEGDCITGSKSTKVKQRRKHHMVWSLPEVLKLVEGVSKHGVGRWTEIKRLLFASSAHRTSVDLKDKWRNLLRASCTRLQSKRGVEPKRKHVSQPMPQDILLRVRELAAIYPYPREPRFKVSATEVIVGSKCDRLMPPLKTAVRA